MNLQQLVRHTAACAAAAILLTVAGAAWADPPSRVARLAYVSGAVSFSPAGENDWSEANINRPLGGGDRLWADDRARVEIQTNGTTVRMDGNTSVAVVNLDDRMTQLQLTQGSLHVRVRRLAANQVVEVDTPNLAFTLRQPGEYRISVDPQADATDIMVRSGSGEAAGEGAAYRMEPGQPYRFTGTGLRDYQRLAVVRPDAFEAWAASRDRQAASSTSARYVSPDVLGYQDLDANGSWRRDPSYGNVWVPRGVAAGWAPYRDGHWSWVDPWGWTWIDDAPWGFAVSHYGRWTRIQGAWAWVPGPMRRPAYYAPAVVAFVGGSNFQITLTTGSVGAVGWFPLAPREVYRPSYPVSRAYFENLNRSNTVINNTVINNTYNVTNVTNVVHVNQRVMGAVTAVPSTVFVQSQPVARSVLRMAPQAVAGAPVSALAPVVPTERSVHGGAAPGKRPPGRTFERPVVATTAAPAPHAGLAAQLAQLAAQPGKPLDSAARKGLKPATAVPAAVVTVLAPVKAAVAPVAPAAVAPAGSSPAATVPPAALPAVPPSPTASRPAPRASAAPTPIPVPAMAASRGAPPAQPAALPAPPASAQERQRPQRPAVQPGALPAPPASAQERQRPQRPAVQPGALPAPPASAQERQRPQPPVAQPAAVPAPAPAPAVAPASAAARARPAAPSIPPVLAAPPTPPVPAAPPQPALRAPLPVAAPAVLPPAPAAAGSRAVPATPRAPREPVAAPSPVPAAPPAAPPAPMPRQTPAAPAAAPAKAPALADAPPARAAASSAAGPQRPKPGASNPRGGDGVRERGKRDDGKPADKG